jgi:hypothetical protein
MHKPNAVLMLLSCLTLGLSLYIQAGAEETKTASADAAPKPLIQMAILLDTSSSMDGLIDQARGQLWKIVNEFITARREGKKPELQVALYEYGKPTLGADSGFIRQIVPFTTDLDKVSQELFALKTNGGDEYCGWVIKTACEQLSWSKEAHDLKVIFICGNEPFTQGSVDYRESCKNAIARGIIVNTIHCGPYQTGVNEKWQDGAMLADGKYSCIEQNKQIVHIDAPQDKAIMELNENLNKTYIAYGRDGKEAQQNQAAQDRNAEKMDSSVASARAATKASANYKSGNWDLVDKAKDAPGAVAELKAEELPEEMKKMSADERKAYIDEKAKARAEIQEKILKLNTERNQFIAEEMKKRGDSSENTLDKVMAKTVREQAEKKSFEFKQ